MKKIAKKIIVLILVFAISVSMFAACGKPDNLIDGHEPVTIKWMHHFTEPARIEWVNHIVSKTQEKYPWITVDVEVQPFDKYKTTLKMKIQGEDAPDLFDLSTRIDILDFVKNDFCADLSKADFISNIITPGIKAGQVGDKVYSIVQDLGGAAVFYNKDMFKANNLEVPKTYSEFMKVLETLKKAGVIPLAQGFQDVWVMMVDTYTDYVPYVYKDDPDWATKKQNKQNKFSDDVKFKEVMGKIWARSQYAQKDRFGTGWAKACDLVASEKAAMIIGGFFALDAIQSVNKDISLGAFAMPINENPKDTMTPLGNAGGFVVYNGEDEKKVDAAKNLLGVILSKEMASEFQIIAKTVSTVKGIADNIHPALQDILNVEADGRAVSSSELISSFSGEYGTAYANALVNFLRKATCDVEGFTKSLDEEFAKIS